MFLLLVSGCVTCGPGTKLEAGVCVSDAATPEDSGPTTPTDTGPDTTDPDDTGPDTTDPDDTGPDDTNPDDTGPDDTGPDDTDPPAAARWAGGQNADDVGVGLLGTFDDDVAGWRVSAGPDLTGDGLPDVVVGAVGSDPVQRTSGQLYVVPGPIVGEVMLADVAVRVRGELENQQVGIAFSSSSDVDGDGAADLLVGSNTVVSTGADGVFLFRGPLSGTLDLVDADEAWRAEEWDDYAGSKVAGVGDIDADGLDDQLIGADSYGDRGAVYLLRNNPSGGDLGEMGQRIAGGGDASSFGRSLAGVGDVNGDGLDDLMVGGSYMYGNAQGGVWLFHGPADDTSWASDADAQVISAEAYENPSSEPGSISSAGDVDGDGLPDLLISDPNTTTTASSAGRLWVLPGTVLGEQTTEIAIARIDGDTAQSWFGWALSAADVDSDGHHDLWIGARGANANGASAGGAYVFYGPIAGGLGVADADAQFDGVAPGDQLGSAVATYDVTDDGYPDLLAGSSSAEGEDEGSGLVWVFSGVP